MPFGLKNAGMSFQRFMDRVLAGLPFVLVYLDDILVASPDRCFIPAAAKILLPLTSVLKGCKKGSEVLEWLPPMMKAFTAIKTALMQPPMMKAFTVSLPCLSVGHHRALPGHRRLCYTCGGSSPTEGQSRC